MGYPKLHVVRSRLFSLALIAFVSGVLFVPLVSAQEDAVPPQIIDKAREYIISKVGEEYFNTYFSFKYSRFLEIGDRPEDNPDETYIVVFNYNLSVGDYSTTVSVAVYFDSGGNITRTEGVPTEGYLMPFKIDRREAIRIARKAGLPRGVTGYTAEIHHYGGELDAYVWSITLWFIPESISYHASGSGATIDVNSGKVYEFWNLHCSGTPAGPWRRPPDAPILLTLTAPFLAFIGLLTPLRIEGLLCLVIGHRLYKGLKYGSNHFPGFIQRIIGKIDSASEETKRNIFKIIAFLPFLPFLYGLFLLADELIFSLEYFRVFTYGHYILIPYRSILGAAILYLGTFFIIMHGRELGYDKWKLIEKEEKKRQKPLKGTYKELYEKLLDHYKGDKKLLEKKIKYFTDWGCSREVAIYRLNREEKLQ